MEGLLLHYNVLQVIDRYLLVGELVVLCPKLLGGYIGLGCGVTSLGRLWQQQSLVQQQGLRQLLGIAVPLPVPAQLVF